MAKILSVNSPHMPPEIEKEAEKENFFKKLWESFNSLDKFTKTFVIFIILFFIALPYIINNYQIFRNRASSNISLGSLRLSATFNSIGIELPFKLDDPSTTIGANLEFKKTGDPDTPFSWRKGLPLWRTDGAADLALASNNTSSSSDIASISRESVQGVSAVQFINDTFTDSEKDLENHTSDSGHSWIKHAATGGTAAISDANRLRPQSNFRTLYYSSASPQTSEYDITADLFVVSSVGDTGLTVRMDDSTDTYYSASYNPGLGKWSISKRVNGVATSLAYTAGQVNTGETYSLKFEVRDSGKKLYVKGPTDADYILKLSTNDNTINTVGRVGVTLNPGGSGGNATGMHLDNFTASSLISTTDIPAPINTSTPKPTSTPIPTSVNTPIPTSVVSATSVLTNTPTPTQSGPTSTPIPTSVTVNTPTPTPASFYTGAFYGSALLLDQNTSYDIRVTIVDANGNPTGNVATGTIKTREDNIPQASSLNPTHFVRTDGNDANSGTSDSPTGAWKTLQKTITSAPSGAIVRVGPGYFKIPSSTTIRTLPIALLAQYPAVDDNRNIINPGKHTIIDSGVVSSAGINTWQLVSMVGPGYGGATAGTVYKIWKWENSGATDPITLGYTSTRDGLPKRVAHWSRKGADLATPEGWVEKLYTNKTYNYGFATFGKDIYVRLPGGTGDPHNINNTGLNPNNYYITAGVTGDKGDTFNFNGPNIRISGFDIRQLQYGIYFKDASTLGIVDHNIFNGNQYGIFTIGKQATPSIYGGDHVFQYNLFKDSTYRSEDQISDPSMPWNFIKMGLINIDGSSYGNRIGERNESNATTGRGGHQRVVIRNNTVDGPFNGFGLSYNLNFDRYGGRDTDIHDNTIMHIADDPLEPDGPGINIRYWNNTLKNTSTFISIAPLDYGPIYVFRNTAWNLGLHDMATDSEGGFGGGGTTGFKLDQGTSPSGLVYFVNNTIWSDKTLSKGESTAGGGGTNPPGFYLRNNIVRVAKYAWSIKEPNLWVGIKWSEDYNHFAAYDPNDSRTGFQFGPLYTTDVQAYRTSFNQGAHTNTLGDFVTTSTVDNNLNNPVSGDLTLKSGSQFIDLGTVVPNIADRAGIDYQGNAPDLGAIESGQIAVPTSTPVPTLSSTSTPVPVTQPIQPTNTPIPTSPSDITSPVVKITYPANGSYVTNNKSLSIQASASDNVGIYKVEFYVNGILKCADLSSPYRCNWKVPKGAGNIYTIIAKAYDKTGNTSTDKIVITSK